MLLCLEDTNGEGSKLMVQRPGYKALYFPGPTRGWGQFKGERRQDDVTGSKSFPCPSTPASSG